MTATSYLSVARAGSSEIEVKRSRFLAQVAPVDSEDAARAVVESARKAHWDARHHCSAFVLGPGATWARNRDRFTSISEEPARATLRYDVAVTATPAAPASRS